MNIPEKDCRIQEDYNDSDCNDNAVDGSGWDNYVEEDERDRGNSATPPMLSPRPTAPSLVSDCLWIRLLMVDVQNIARTLLHQIKTLGFSLDIIISTGSCSPSRIST